MHKPKPPSSRGKKDHDVTETSTFRHMVQNGNQAESSADIRRNDQGGIYVDPQELKQAFAFFDPANKGFVTADDLKKRLEIFYPGLSTKEYSFLMNQKEELTYHDLYFLLVNNELTNYDPVAEAFKVYDPTNSGYIDEEAFKSILSNLGLGEITEEDMKTLIKSADVDGDGKISLNDFRLMIPSCEDDNNIQVSEDAVNDKVIADKVARGRRHGVLAHRRNKSKHL